MIAFEVSVNGQRLCTAGVGDYGLLHAEVAWKLNDAARVAKGQPAGEMLNVSLAGIGVDSTNYRRPHAPLRPGDEVLVRICETSAVDAPSESRPHLPVRISLKRNATMFAGAAGNWAGR